MGYSKEVHTALELTMFIGTDDVHLKPANYQNRANLLPLVDAIVKETEHERERQRANESPRAAVLRRGQGLIQGPGPDYYPCDHRPWYELLTDWNVISRCAVALGIEKTALLKLVIEELGPPNWLVFFWMREWHQSVPVADYIEMVKATVVRIKVARESRTKSLSEAGKSGAKGKNKRTDELKQWALENATGMLGADKDNARLLHLKLPTHLASASKDPERLIYDALRARKKPN